MSAYPPDDHVLRDLQIESWLETPEHCVAELPVTPPLLGPDGTVTLGALVTLVDIACARVSFAAAHPHWIATADLSIVSGAPVREGTVTAESRVSRAGSKLIGIDVDLHGAGTATATFVRIPREASKVDRPMPQVGDRSRMELLGRLPDGPLTERMGLRPTDDGAELDNVPYVSNSFGTINGGVLGFLVSAAAEQVTGQRASDLVLRYLGQTKVGPARASATVVRRDDAAAVVDVTVRDAGAEGLLLARATVWTRRAD